MIIQLSDYMLEQTVSDANVSDITLEQYDAQIEVSTALVRAYSKAMDMMIYSEADTSTSTEEKPGLLKRIWAAIVKAWEAICGWFKRRWEAIRNFFSKSGKAKAVAAEAKKTLADMPGSTPPPTVLKITGWLGVYSGAILYLADKFDNEFLPVFDEFVALADTDKKIDGNKARDLTNKLESMYDHTVDALKKALGSGDFDPVKAIKRGSVVAQHTDISLLDAMMTDIESQKHEFNQEAQKFIMLAGMQYSSAMSKDDVIKALDKISADCASKIQSKTRDIDNKLQQIESAIKKASQQILTAKIGTSNTTITRSDETTRTVPGMDTLEIVSRQPNKMDSKSEEILNTNKTALTETFNSFKLISQGLQVLLNSLTESVNKAWDKQHDALKEYKQKREDNKGFPKTVSNANASASSSSGATLTNDGELPANVKAWYNRHKDEIGRDYGTDPKVILSIYNNEVQRKTIGESFYYV